MCDMRNCAESGCDRPIHAHELCTRHYARRPVKLDEIAMSRFWERVDTSGQLGCWLWTGPLTSYGYGVLNYRGVRFRAHRVSFEAHTGRKIAADEVIDHICRTRHCVNPQHLRTLSSVDNVMIGISLPAMNARRSQCDRGHVFDEANTRVNKRGWRDCRACDRERALRYWRKRRAETPAKNISRDGNCMAPDCERPRDRRGLCHMHYARQRRLDRLVSGRRAA